MVQSPNLKTPLTITHFQKTSIFDERGKGTRPEVLYRQRAAPSMCGTQVQVHSCMESRHLQHKEETGGPGSTSAVLREDHE